ncbi:ankyrin repeat domain-containing protein [Henriciella litoralis]|uniref:ankyrin repeat domain-containing protein n=1 Tax=Henriciella litoralis TaxID=568102 RepID=UPI000A041C7D|nr:ankyrin repeat domain-containing protein [Henriciella litoralis]
MAGSTISNMVRAGLADRDNVYLACAMSLGIDFGASAAAYAGLKASQPALKFARGLLGTDRSDSNHRLFQMVHEVKWQALKDLLTEIDRDKYNKYNTKEGVIGKLYGIAYELQKADISKHLDPRNLDAPSSKTTLQKCLSWALRGISAQSPEISTFSDSDQFLVRGLDEILSREASNSSGYNAATEADATSHNVRLLTSRLAAEALLEELGNRAFASNGLTIREKASNEPSDAQRRPLSHFLEKFDDPSTGWLATYRFRIKERLCEKAHEDEYKRIILNFSSEIGLKTDELITHTTLIQGLIKDLDENFDERLCDIEQALRAIDQHFRKTQLPLDPQGADTHSQDGVRFLNYVYRERMTEFVGRQTEMSALREFLNHPSPVRWWQIAGDGGQGKSRLALELIRDANDRGWRAGFLRSDQLEKVDWSALQFHQPTLCVVDYVASPQKAQNVAKGLVERIRQLDKKTEDENFRLLLVERSPYASPDHNMPALWFSAFCETGHRQIIESSKHGDYPVPLDSLTPEAMKQIARSWRESNDRPIPEADHLDQMLSNMSRQGVSETRPRAWRPLIAMVLIDIIMDGTAGQTASIGEALEFLLEEEQKRSWTKIIGRKGQPSDAAARQAILATILGELDIEDINSDDDFYKLRDVETRIQAWAVLGYDIDASASKRTMDIPLKARVPDLLGEYLVDWLRLRRSDYDRLIKDAWTINPSETYSFLVRLGEDHKDLGITKTFQQLACFKPNSLTAENAQDFDLNAASFFGFSGLASKLLEFGHSVSAENSNGGFPLLYAAQEGHADIVRALLENGASINQLNEFSGTFPLLQAAQNGHTDIVCELLENGASVNQQNEVSGTFPLLMASQEGHTDIVRALLEKRANVNQFDEVAGTFSVLQAAQNGHTDIVRDLLDKGADVNQENEISGTFPLLQAAKNGHTDIIRALLEKGANVNQMNVSSGNFPLLMAAQEGHADIVRALLKVGADLNQQDETSGTFPLLMAAQEGHAQIVNILLEKGADANQIDRLDGTFPLVMAAQNGHTEIVCELLENGASVNQQNEISGAFPLLQAAQEGHTEIVCELLKNGASVNQQNKISGTFPLLQAAQTGHTEVVCGLLENGASVNQQNKISGTFPLLQAAQHGCADIVRALVEAGADVNQRNETSGMFPLLVAAGNGHTEVIARLIENKVELDQIWSRSGTNSLELCLNMFASKEANSRQRHSGWRGAKALLEAGATLQDGTTPDLPDEPECIET